MLDGMTAFVTGASQGIGREIALTLAKEGAQVVLAARSEGIYDTAAEIGDDDRTLAIETDVTDEANVAVAISETVDTFGGLDCLINNAGIAGPTVGIEDITVEEWQQTMDVNVLGMFLTVKHAVEHLQESNQASIVNISSISGKRPLINRTPYTASKMAVIGLTRTLAFELGDDDITVNAICPGPVRGPRLERVIRRHGKKTGLSYEEAQEDMVGRDMALDTLVEAEDIANMVAFLASDKARHVTAQDISVDSGVTWY